MKQGETHLQGTRTALKKYLLRRGGGPEGSASKSDSGLTWMGGHRRAEDRERRVGQRQ